VIPNQKVIHKFYTTYVPITVVYETYVAIKGHKVSDGQTLGISLLK